MILRPLRPVARAGAIWYRLRVGRAGTRGRGGLPLDAAAIERERTAYVERSPRSRAILEEGARYLPDGVTRGTGWEPYPLFWDRGEGCRVWDVDGIDRLDFFGNNSALPLGHAHPAVVDALERRMAAGVSFNAPHEAHITLARIICERIESIERVRFTSSGTEATMNCVHAARAFTGRSSIAKVDGAYHGLYDAVAFAGPGSAMPHAPDLPAMPPHAAEQVVTLPFNDPAAAEEIVGAHGDELAAVVVEPMMGGAGFIEADREYLAALRELTSRNGIVLVFDEVCSLRAGPGAGQGYFGVYPDLTALGKSVGGGTPLGAFGGREEIMRLFGADEVERHVGHSGSFNGNPLSMVSGAATFEQLTPRAYERLDRLASRLREGIRAVCGEFDVPVRVTGIGSLFGVHFTDRPVHNARDARRGDPDRRMQVFLGLMNEGIWTSPSLIGAVSTPMGDDEVDAYLDALRAVLARSSG